jgi:cell division protein FtsN
VSGVRQRMSARDYKHGPRGGGFDPMQYKQFGAGLATGLAVALLVWVYGQRQQEEQPEEPVAQNIVAAPEVPPDEAGPVEQLDFYVMAPNQEVVIAADNTGTRRAAQPTAPITKPGAYVIQASASRSRTGAERERDRLAKLGIDATIQHVTIDESEWHRVLIGPLRDLKKVNEVREVLRSAQITFRTYEVGE